MEHAWIARSVRPIVAGYVAAVFVVFMALAYFVFHSPDAVKALFLTAIGAVASVAPGILGRVEYRLTADGLARRPLADKKPRELCSSARTSLYVLGFAECARVLLPPRARGTWKRRAPTTMRS
jgi:hypothetical protein